MRRKWSRLVAGLLSIVMLVTMLPMEVLAANKGSEEEQPSQTMPFRDVKASDWYAEAVEYVYSHNIFNGTSATTFAPDGTMTRGMFVTVLGRMAGVDPDDYSGETPFSDVPQTMYYAPYVQWAAKYGITAGTGDGKFSPDAFINRAQLAVFFVRYFEAFQVDYETDANVTTTPADMESVPAYARDAVLKLWKQGLLNGDGKHFAPEDSATRAQTATLCMRADDAVAVWYSAPGVVGRKSDETPQKDEQSKPNSNGGSSGGNSSGSTAHTITLHLPDGTTSTFTQTASSLSLADLPTPSVAGKAFIGWYYDAGYTKAVADGDPLSTNLSLYAKMVDYDAIEGVETPNYAGATDVGPDFNIIIKSSTAESDLTGKIKLIGTEQPTNQTDKDGNTITTVGNIKKNSDGTYTVSPPESGWAEGGTYKVVLEDDSLTFDGEAASVREYHFTVKVGTPALNWHLKDDVVTIPANSIQSVKQNGKAVATLDMPVVTFDGNGTTANDVSDSTGTFVYNGELEIGSTVAIYEGVAPEERLAVGTDDANTGDVSYVKITGVDKSTNTYTYQSAAVEDVLFVPDVLPVKVGHKDTSASDTHTIHVPVEELTFTASAETEEKLNESTTVDVGDFLVFYEGESYTTDAAKAKGYGLITAVGDSTDEDTGAACYEIVYTDTTEEAVLSSMDVDTTDPISGDAILGDVDTAELEKQIAQQAIDSGFAQTVADRISAALDEMDLSDLTAGGAVNLSAADIDPDGTFGLSALSGSSAVPLAGGNAGGGGKTSVKVKTAKISKQLQNFKDASGNPLSGVRLELQLEVEKEIQSKEGDGSIVITVTPTFIQELKLDLSTHGKLVWKHKFIFYWISDVYLEAALNVYTYTAINLDATIVSKGEDDTVTKVKDAVTKVQDLVDKLGKKLDALEGKDTGNEDGEDDEIDTSKLSLQELYSNMLELDSDWVELYRKNIFSLKKTVAKIIKFELTVDFVVEMNIRMALGLNFNYTNAKRYVFGVYIFKGRTTSHTYNIVNEQYNLRLYAMGAIGLRAGVELYPSVSLISKNVASVGIIAKLGAYLKGYGYVLYNLHYEAGKPKTSNASGALYVEVGMFMDISANLSAFKGKVSWTPELYADETPLWSVGNPHAAEVFAMQDAVGADDEPAVSLKWGGLDVVLPESLQTLSGFDLTTGETRSEVYDWNNFDISFSDPRFTSYHTGDYGGNYSQQHIKLTLPDWKTREDPQLDCVMTITYKGSDLSFFTSPIQLKVKVHWDRLRDGYPIYELNELDSLIGWEQRAYGAALDLNPPIRAGYDFVGWTYYLVADENNIYTYDKEHPYTDSTLPVMPESALVALASFTPRDDVVYTLNLYLQNEDGSYPDTPSRRVTGTGTADTFIVPDAELVPYIAGYDRPGVSLIYIRADGSTEKNYYYARAPYKLILHSGDQVSTMPYYYGDTIDLPESPTRPGYTFGGWYADVEYNTEWTAETMPSDDINLYAKWIANDINYFVVLRKEGADGRWSQTTITQIGKTGEEVTFRPTSFLTQEEAGIYDFPAEVQYTISAGDDGTVYLSYARKRFSLTYQLNAADATWISNPGVRSFRLGAKPNLLTKSYLTRAGYTFDGWYTDADCTNAFTATAMPAENVTLYAKWIAQGDISYTVEHYQQNVTGDGYTLADTEPMTGATGATTAAAAKSYTGFTAQSFEQQTINGNGSTVVKVYYTRNKYTLTYDLNGSGASWTDGGTTNRSGIYRFDADVTLLTSSDLGRAGYAFDGWYTDAECTTKFASDKMPAENITLYAKWNAGQVNYTVNYYLQNVDGSTYPNTPNDTVEGSGVTGQTVDLQKSFEGFTLRDDAPASIILTADSAQNVANLYYTRNQYTLTFNLGNGVKLDESSASAPTDGSIYYGAALSTDMTGVKRTGYTFVGWYEDAEYETEWNGTTMPARDLNLYAKWDVLTYILRFDWGGNVQLKNWLLEKGGKLLTAEYDKTTYKYINANDDGIPYIDVTVEYDQVFALPTNIPGAEYFGYYKEEANNWGTAKKLVQAESLTKMAAEQDAVVEVGTSWLTETVKGVTMIYNVSQFLAKVFQAREDNAKDCALGADLDFCNNDRSLVDGAASNVTFDGRGHTIYHVHRGEWLRSGGVAGIIYRYGDNITVKDLTIDGMTVDYTAEISASENYYHAFGALAGYVGDGFTAQNVTVKNVTMNLELLGEKAKDSYYLLPAESIGGLIGYAEGSVTLTGCKVENMVVNVTDKNDDRGTKFLIGGFIGYADALYTSYYDGENRKWSYDYSGNGSVTIQGCKVANMTVNKNGATGVTVGGLIGGICKSATSKDEMTYSVTANIEDTNTVPAGLGSIGNVPNSADSGESAAQSLDALLPTAFENEPDEENAAA